MTDRDLADSKNRVEMIAKAKGIATIACMDNESKGYIFPSTFIYPGCSS